MNFENFIKRGQIKKSKTDISLIKSICKNTIKDLKYLNSQKITEESSRKLFVGYYDSLRAILEAIASLKGFKIYQHEAFTYFLKELNEKIIAEKFDRLRKIRNSINYYGAEISTAQSKENIEEVRGLVNLLIDKYLKEFK